MTLYSAAKIRVRGLIDKLMGHDRGPFVEPEFRDSEGNHFVVGDGYSNPHREARHTPYHAALRITRIEVDRLSYRYSHDEAVGSLRGNQLEIAASFIPIPEF